MSFDRAWVLWIAWVPLLWLYRAWFAGRQRRQVALKALSVCAVLLALAEPRMSTSETKLAVPVLVDTSESISEQDLARASRLAGELEDAKGRNWVKIIPFARGARALSESEQKGGVRLGYTSGESGRGTDLEAAMREAMAAMPEGLVPRMVLISDGKENQGSATRATQQARNLGVPVDVLPLAGRPKPELRLEAVSAPLRAFTGDRFPIDVTLEAPRKATARFEVSAEGKAIGTQMVELEKGMNRLRVHVALTVPGAIDLKGVIQAEGLGEVRFAQSVSLRRPRALLVTQDPEGTEKHLAGVLAGGQFEMVMAEDLEDAKWADLELVILNNVDLEAIPPATKDRAEKWVKQGGGLLLLGGEKLTFLESKKTEDAMDRLLPAKLAPPRSPEGTLVVLIVDKSSSMEGRKMELARVASIGVIENLRGMDFVGVLIFDNSFQWAVPIRKAEDRTLIKRLVAGITPDGGTQIAPALTEAYRKTLPVKATFKHVVLLTDGISEEGDSLSLAREAATQSVTISTVGLGQDVNRSYLERIAALSKGKSYFLNDPAGLEQILLKDVMEFTGSTAIEKPLVPTVERQAEILEGVGMESAPALRGYTKFIAKPTAETILSFEKKDPLLTRWQYGLGRTMVFTSDAKSRWAEQWVTWKGFDRFWANALRDLLPQSQTADASVEFDPAASSLRVTYRLGPTETEPPAAPQIFAIGPGGFQQAVDVQKTGQGLYTASLPIGTRQGLFRIRPLAENRQFPEIGYYRQEAELSEWGNNEPLLRQLAGYTGGRYQPQVAQVFQAGGRSVETTTRLWPLLLVLAVLLNLGELILRKWRGVVTARREAVG